MGLNHIQRTDPGRKTVTFAAAANILDTDGYVASVATATSVVNVTGALFDGTLAGGANPDARCELQFTINRSSSASSYTTTPIVVTGTDDGGEVITESLTPADADGGDQLVTTKGFRSVTNVKLPAQVDTSGAWTMGVSKILLTSVPARMIRTDAAGTLKMVYEEGTSGTISDNLPSAATEKHELYIKEVLSTSTGYPITLYF